MASPALTPVLNALAIGGHHQFAHFLPVAFELSRRGSCRVSIFAPSRRDIPAIHRLAEKLGHREPDVVVMDLPGAAESLIPRKLDKVARLFGWASHLRRGHALLCAERTSTILKRLPGRCPPIIHIPHGAGDRAVGFEKRFSLFDTVVVAGAKDRDRMVSEGIVAHDRCHVSGPVKLATMLQGGSIRQRLFPGSPRPTLLYNPHFDPALGSGQAFAAKLVEAVMRDDRYDLIIAPHIRMASLWNDARRREWERMAVPGRIEVDLGSDRSIDMTYTRSADLYIGDVSSQVYEFLVEPRPCLFVNAHDAAWEGDESYAMWRFGEVISPVGDLSAALENAFARHAAFLPVQKARTQSAFDCLDWDEDGRAGFSQGDPIARAADIIEDRLCRLSGMDGSSLASTVIR